MNVRAAATINSPVTARLTINTEVKLSGKEAVFCEISWGQASAQQHGYIACRLLSTKPVTLKDLAAQTKADGTADSSYAVRAFWLEPTYERFLAAANHFENTMLPQKQRAIEKKFLESGNWENPPEIKRFAIPELDAMRNKLAAGVVAPKTMARLALPWSGKAISDLHNDALHLWVYEQIKLDSVKPSLFKSSAEIASAKVWPESISAQFDIPWNLKVTGAPAWGGNSNDGPTKTSVWDMGMVTQQLNQPVYVAGLNKNTGLLIKKSSLDQSFLPSGYQESCPGDSRSFWPNSEGETETIQPLFRYKTNINTSKARLTNKPQILLQPKALGSDPLFVRATTTYIDVDGDGIADLAVWDGINIQAAVGQPEEFHFKLIFVNILGHWHFLEYEEEVPPCGC